MTLLTYMGIMKVGNRTVSGAWREGTCVVGAEPCGVAGKCAALPGILPCSHLLHSGRGAGCAAHPARALPGALPGGACMWGAAAQVNLAGPGLTQTVKQLWAKPDKAAVAAS